MGFFRSDDSFDGRREQEATVGTRGDCARDSFSLIAREAQAPF